jgi:hypothetical protein
VGGAERERWSGAEVGEAEGFYGVHESETGCALREREVEWRGFCGRGRWVFNTGKHYSTDFHWRGLMRTATKIDFSLAGR